MIPEQKSTGLIYLACPLRHADPSIQRKRCFAAHYVTAKLFSQGLHVFSPLTHNEVLIDLLQDTIPGEHWLQFDLKILRHCSELLILKMEGWDISKGVQREILFAEAHKIPIGYAEPPTEDVFLKHQKEYHVN